MLGTTRVNRFTFATDKNQAVVPALGHTIHRNSLVEFLLDYCFLSKTCSCFLRTVHPFIHYYFFHLELDFKITLIFSFSTFLHVSNEA